MQILDKPKATRKFSQSCATKQDFIDLLVELRDRAENKKYNPELSGPGFSQLEQEAYNNGECAAYDWLLHELSKSPDTRTY
jgi:hypothetical protein